MIMLGVYRTGKVPFESVFLHGLVLDEKGQKMSKSKGNVINPMEAVSQYGSDALRLGIVANRTAGQNQAFSTATVVAGRNFCNKLWNIARFIEPLIEDNTQRTPEPKTAADHWIMRELDGARKDIEKYLKNYQFAEASDAAYHTIWDSLADWYLEASKTEPTPSVLSWALETSLLLVHPFAPFVTETIWTTLEWEKTLLMTSPWPKKAHYDEKLATDFDSLRTLITEARFVANELPGGKQTLLYHDDTLIASHTTLIQALAHLERIEHVETPRGLRLAVPGREVWLDVDEKTLYDHQQRLEKRLSDVKSVIDRLEGRLANESYVQQAPKRVVDETRDELLQQKDLADRLGRELQIL